MTEASTITLADLKQGQSATIATVGGEGALRQHFLDMGITPGAPVTFEKYAPLGDPMEFTIRGYSLTLRKADAAQNTVDLDPATALVEPEPVLEPVSADVRDRFASPPAMHRPGKHNRNNPSIEPQIPRPARAGPSACRTRVENGRSRRLGDKGPFPRRRGGRQGIEGE